MRAAWLTIALLWLGGCASYPPPYEYDDPYYASSGYNGVYDDAWYEDYGPRYRGVYDVTRSYDPWFSLYWTWDYYGYSPYRHGYWYDRHDPFGRYGYGWSLRDPWWASWHYSAWSPYWSPWYGSAWYWRPHYYRPSGGHRDHPSSRQALREATPYGVPGSFRPRPQQRAASPGLPVSGPRSNARNQPAQTPRQWIGERPRTGAPDTRRWSSEGDNRGTSWQRNERSPQPLTVRPSPSARSGPDGSSRSWMRNDSSPSARPQTAPRQDYSRPSAPASRQESRPSMPASRSSAAPERSGGSARAVIRGGDGDRRDD